MTDAHTVKKLAFAGGASLVALGATTGCATHDRADQQVRAAGYAKKAPAAVAELNGYAKEFLRADGSTGVFKISIDPNLIGSGANTLSTDQRYNGVDHVVATDGIMKAPFNPTDRKFFVGKDVENVLHPPTVSTGASFYVKELKAQQAAKTDASLIVGAAKDAADHDAALATQSSFKTFNLDIGKKLGLTPAEIIHALTSESTGTKRMHLAQPNPPFAEQIASLRDPLPAVKPAAKPGISR